MKFKLFALLFFLLLAIGNSMGQVNPRGLRSDATTYFEKEKYRESLNLFLKYQRLKPADEEVKQMIGICYYHANGISNAKRYLQFVISNEKTPDPIVFSYLAKAYHAESDYTNAIKFYKEYLRQTKIGKPFREGIKDDIRRCATAMRLSSQEEIAVVENLGEKVNTPYDDFAPIISPNYSDKIYFSSARNNTTGGPRAENGFADERYGAYRSDMFSSVVVNGEWTGTKPFGTLLNSARHDVILDFSEKGSVMYFFKGNDYFSGEILVDSFNKVEQNLFPATFSGPALGAEGDRDIFFFKDSILLFSSNRPGGKGGSDLYISTFTRGHWTPAKNLGSNINGPYDERTPYLSKDGRTLYFSSNNTNSIGGLDIFKARYDDNTLSWSEPVNVGAPINSSGDDAFFRLSKDGLKAFFSSSRKDGLGERDLYVAYFKGYQNEQRKVSIPIAFNFVPEFKRRQTEGSLILTTTDSPQNPSGREGSTNPTFQESEIVKQEFAPLYFGTDEKVLTFGNLKELNRVARLMMEYPQMRIQINSHFDGSSPVAFDLFFSIKRAEKAAEYLIDNGVKPANVTVKGSGSSYPVAKVISEAGTASNGNSFNRRLDLSFHNLENLPLSIAIEKPRVQASLKDSRGRYFQQMTEGLSYKVQVAAIRQNYSSDIITTYPDALVESVMDESVYRYSIGFYKTYTSANQLRQELIAKGLDDAFVVPYIDGFRATANEARVYSKIYPDLVNFLTNAGQ